MKQVKAQASGWRRLQRPFCCCCGGFCIQTTTPSFEEKSFSLPLVTKTERFCSTTSHILQKMRRDVLTHADRVRSRLKCGLHSSSFHTQEFCSNVIYLCSGLLGDAEKSSKHSASTQNSPQPHPLLFQALEFDQGEAIFKQPTFSHSFFFFFEPYY